MAGLYDGLELAPGTPPAAPRPPPGMYDGLEVVQTQPAPRPASGFVEHVQAGVQNSVLGLAWRGKLPELVMNPDTASWWERLATGVTQVGMDLPIMIPAGSAGATAGAGAGAAAGPAGAAVGGVLGGGAAMFAAPAAIRESLVQAYAARDADTPADWFNIVRSVALATLKEGAVGAVTMGAGSLAARTAGKALAPSIGQSIGVGTATKAIGTADVAAQIAAMTTMPAAMHGRLPEAREFADAAAVILTLKAGHMVVDRALGARTAERIANTYVKTGKTPAEQIEDAKADPRVAEDLMREPTKAEEKAGEMPTIQEALFRDTARLSALEEKAAGTPERKVVDDFGNELTIPGKPGVYLTDAEKAELAGLRTRVADLEAQARPGGLATPAPAAEGGAREVPIRITREAHDASAQRVYDTVLEQVRAADRARIDSGLAPLGDEHAQAVAALVKARARTRAARLGVLPEEIFNERPLQIRDETAAEVAAAEAAIPPEAPRFAPPEKDIFGNPIEAPNVPRYAVEGLQTVELPLENLVLSKEVPQFKAKANTEGVVVPLGGKFDRTGVGPIQVWERLDGTLEVITGRHRLDLARRSGETTIPAQVHREADGFTARKAATLDAQLNIREEQGSIADYAQYFKDAGIEEKAAHELGLLARAKGRAGFSIARDGSADLLAAHRAGVLSDEAALSISQAAPQIERLQALGMAMVQSGKSILIATNTMKAVGVMASERAMAGEQGDIFGFDDSAMQEASRMAKAALARQRQISEQISAVSGASKRPELAAKMGVDVKDPAAIRQKIVELRQEQELWDNWPMHPDLVAQLRAPSITGREGELKQGPVDEFALKPETPEELRARDAEAAAQAKRQLAREAALDRAAAGPKVKVDQADLFNTQGTLFQGASPLRITRNPNLSPELRAVEDRFARFLERDIAGAIEAYEKLPASDGGKILNTDIARELSPDYAKSKDARSKLSAAVHEPASALVKFMYEMRLRNEPGPEELPIVAFTAGGTGAGKTGAISNTPLAAEIVKGSQIVYDTNLSTFESSVSKIEQALAAGKQAVIMYVGRDPIEALRGAVKRAEKIGRTVPIHEHAATHVGASRTVDALVERYDGNPNVEFIFLDNRGAKGEVAIGGRELPTSYNFTNLNARLKEALNAEYKAGRASAQVYEGFAGHAPEGGGEALWGVGGGLLAGQYGQAREGRQSALPPEEVGGAAAAPAPGQKFLVFRLGDSGALENRNAGNADAVARYIMGTEDAMGPIQSRANTVFAYEVSTDAPFGRYEGLAGAARAPGENVGRVVRGDEVAYSFPETGFSARMLGARSLDYLRAQLQSRGLQNFDDAGTKEGARVIRDVFAADAERLAMLNQEHRGSFQVAENLITILQSADKSTVVHELSHSWLEEMRADAARPDAPAQIKADWEILRRELAIPESGDIPRASHEQFARSGERYLAEGRSPSVELRGVFERFKAWLLEIYRDLANLNVQINPEIRGIFDRMLATDQEIADAAELGVPRAYVAEAKVQEARKIVPGFKAEQISMEPFADELPKGPGEAPANSHVNYAYINTPLDVKLTMQRMAEIDQANIQKQRGGTEGVKSWAEANAEQAKYLNDILGGNEDTLRILSPRDPDAPGPDVRLGILKKLAVGAAKDSARLRDVVLEAGHDATVRQQLEYMGSIERARMIQAEFLGERASVARALNALKDLTEGSGEIGWMLDAIGYGEEAARTLYQDARTPEQERALMRAKLDEILQNYRGKTVLDIARLHKEIGTLKGTFKMVKELEKATTWEMVIEGWKSALLSGPVTHTTNLFGTGAFQAMRAPVDMLASIIGVARGASPGMGESDRASMSEAIARITGMLGGIQDGLRVAAAAFKADEPTGKTESYRKAIPGTAGDIIRIPLRLMGSEDALVSTMYKRGELATLAIRKAFDEQLNPGTREFAERVDYLKEHPTTEMEVAAEAAATRMTFNAPLGEKGVALQLFVNRWNLQWVVPFIRTPINITKELGRMSPFAPMVGEWRADIAKGGVARDRAIAELAIGSAVMAITMAYTFSGQISGSGSPDPGKNRGRAGVWQQNSWLIGDTWYEYSRIQPIGTLMGLAADLAETWDHMTEEEKDKVPKMLARAFANAVTNQTFLQGITNVVNAMSDPTRFGPRFIQQLAGSAVPNIIGQPTTMADPVVREVNGALEAIQARIPGMRQDLLPKVDWLGEDVKTKERLGFVMPVREQKVSEDKVRQEAARLDISMAAAPKKTHLGKGTGKIGDVELTPEERNTFAKVGGEMAHKILDNIVNAPGYDNIPDLIKRRIFSRVLIASHQVAAVAALPPAKRVEHLKSITEKFQAELAPGAEE